MTRQVRPVGLAGVLIALAVFVGATSVSSGAISQTIDRIAATKTLRIGFVPGQAPFSSKGSDGLPTGYAIELCHAVADDIGRLVDGVRTEYVEHNIVDGFKAIAADRVDLLCGAITITLGRREMVDFSEPVFLTGASALLRSDSPRDLRELFFGERTISGPRSPELRPFTASRVGVRGSTTTETLLRNAIAEGKYSATVVNFESHADGLAALGARDVDAYFADRALLVSLLEAGDAPSGVTIGSRLLSREPYGIAMKRGDTELRLLVDRVLSRLFATPEFTTLLSKYFRGAVPSLRAQILLQSIPE